MEHINRFGEVHPRPATGRDPFVPLVEDEYGMARDEPEGLDPDWSHDPRSTSAHEGHIESEVSVTDEDTELRQKVLLALYLDPDIPAENIAVEVKARVVSLRGVVGSRREKIAIEHCIENLKSVEDICNYLEIKD